MRGYDFETPAGWHRWYSDLSALLLQHPSTQRPSISHLAARLCGPRCDDLPPALLAARAAILGEFEQRLDLLADLGDLVRDLKQWVRRAA